MWWRKNKKNPLINMHEGAQIQRLIDYIEVVNRGHNTTEMDMEMKLSLQEKTLPKFIIAIAVASTHSIASDLSLPFCIPAHLRLHIN
jgi:hypothetical protein